MQRYRTVGQWFWFTFGAWIVLAFVGLIEPLMGVPVKIRNHVDDGSLLPLMIGFLLPGTLVVTSLFAVRHNLRTNRLEQSTTLEWWIPFGLGLTYYPALMLILYDSFALIKHAPWWVGETFGFVIPIGLPALYAEACLRLALRRNEPAL